MGAFSPTPHVTPAVAEMVERDVLLPAVRELARRGRPFRGALYAGLMLTPRGPRVLEFNARLGDPETQPILLRLASDLVPALLASARGATSPAIALEFDPARGGGRGARRRGLPGRGGAGRRDRRRPRSVRARASQVFHAGTAFGAGGAVVTSGGRVLTVCALGADLDAAAARAYAAAARIRFRGMQYRKDIGKKP